MSVKRSLSLAAVMAVALLTFVNAGPAEAIPCESICTCSSLCSRYCGTLQDPSTCGEYGLCQTEPECTTCGCGSYTYGTSGADTLSGGSGNDCIYGGDGGDTIYGNDGNDKLYGEGDPDTIYGGAGNDCIYGGPQNDYLDGGSGTDELNGQGGTGDTCVNGEIVSYCE